MLDTFGHELRAETWIVGADASAQEVIAPYEEVVKQLLVNGQAARKT